MKVEIDITSLRREKEKIFGLIYFSSHEFFFPAKDWNDFIIIVLNWWCSAIQALIDNTKIKEELLFMDGPFSVKIGYFKENYFTLIFMTEERKAIITTEVLKDEFIKDFLSQINSLLRKLEELRWSNEEIEKLHLNFAKLRKSYNGT